MDLRSFKLHLIDRHARLVFADARGERPADLDGEAFDRALEAARPLVDAIAARAGEGAKLRAISVDASAQVIRASLDSHSNSKNIAKPDPKSIDNSDFESAPALRIDGADWDALATAVAGAARAIAEVARPRGGPFVDPSPSEVQFWSGLYREQRDGWELGRAAPPLARWFAAHSPSGRRALVVGCGRGHEARLLARAGANVTGIDFAAEAIADARALAEREGVPVDFRQRDLFELGRDPDRYDLAVEHTCFCAIDPARRDEYVAVIADVLAPGGELIALFWAHGRPGGPPYTVDDAELRARFGARFEFLHVEIPRDSVALRAGTERLVQLRKK